MEKLQIKARKKKKKLKLITNLAKSKAIIKTFLKALDYKLNKKHPVA